MGNNTAVDGSLKEHNDPYEGHLRFPNNGIFLLRLLSGGTEPETNQRNEKDFRKKPIKLWKSCIL